jgi:phosphoglycolate phosphatase-like HAD superfamily hydrolase
MGGSFAAHHAFHGANHTTFPATFSDILSGMSERVEIMSDLQTIIWDLDGTLLDSFGIYRDCLNEVLRTLCRPEVTERIFRNNHHGSIEESIANVLQEAEQKVTKAELSEIIRRFYVLDNASIEDVDRHLFEDAVDLAERAHKAGKYQIVVTNRPHGANRGNGSPRSLVANSRLKSFMGDVLCGDDSDCRKPHREFLEARFGAGLTKIGRPVVIGDQFVDAEFAHNIGCAAILVTRSSDKITHMDRLSNWESYVQIVPSLRNVAV